MAKIRKKRAEELLTEENVNRWYEEFCKKFPSKASHTYWDNYIEWMKKEKLGWKVS